MVFPVAPPAGGTGGTEGGMGCDDSDSGHGKDERHRGKRTQDNQPADVALREEPPGRAEHAQLPAQALQKRKAGRGAPRGDEDNTVGHAGSKVFWREGCRKRHQRTWWFLR